MTMAAVDKIDEAYRPARSRRFTCNDYTTAGQRRGIAMAYAADLISSSRTTPTWTSVPEQVLCAGRTTR